MHHRGKAPDARRHHGSSLYRHRAPVRVIQAKAGGERITEGIRRKFSDAARGTISVWNSTGRYVTEGLISPLRQCCHSATVAVARPPADSACEELSLTWPVVLGEISTNVCSEVDRALDNLVNSGKLFNPSSRRDSVPIMGGQRPYADYGTIKLLHLRGMQCIDLCADPRIGGPPSRQHSVNEFDPMRSHSASNLQNFYANQRYQPRPSEAEQVMQAKRRMAAQRERELRNYHQEQQYNRSGSLYLAARGYS